MPFANSESLFAFKQRRWKPRFKAASKSTKALAAESLGVDSLFFCLLIIQQFCLLLQDRRRVLVALERVVRPPARVLLGCPVDGGLSAVQHRGGVRRVVVVQCSMKRHCPTCRHLIAWRVLDGVAMNPLVVLVPVILGGLLVEEINHLVVAHRAEA